MTVQSTRASLIQRLSDPRDEVAWKEFAELYGPLVFAYGRKRGLQESDALDLVQDVLQIVLNTVAKFDLGRRGSFRGWLLTITLNRIRRKHILSQRQVAGSGRTTIANVLQDQAEEEQEWNRQHRRRLFQWAADEIRGEFKERTWQAFWRTSVDGQSVATVAQQLQVSPGAIYVAKNRIIRRIREKVAYAADREESLL